jgi:2-polyprenyl-6-methoxyphenol hydroxylase-like FAD-dependent oxidoreductase
VLLVGDAAFTARPHVGLGVSKAAEDATTLAAVLTAPEQRAALAEWEAQRLRYGRAAMRWGQELGSYIKAPADTPEFRAKAEYYARPDVLMTVTAASEPSQYLDL